MELFYGCNLAAAFLLQFAPVWFSTRYLRLPPLNPFSIVVMLGLPIQVMKLYAGPFVLIEDGLFDTGYQFAVLMGNTLIVMQTISLVVFYRLFSLARIEWLLPLQRTTLSRVDLRRAVWFFTAIYLFSLYLLASAEYGAVNWLLNPRVGYQLYRTGQGHWYALAVSALSVAAVLSGLRNLPSARRIIVSGLFYLALGYLLGSKGVLLAIFTMTLIMLWFAGWRHLQKMLLIGAPLVFGLLVWNLYLALSDAFELQAILEYFDYYKNAADYYTEYMTGRLALFHGDVALSSLWAYVPRGIWPDKPAVYGILLVNEIFYPGQAELTNTPAFGGAVEQFADFGFAGVVIYGLFSVQSLATALLSYALFRRPGFLSHRITVATAVLFIIQFSPGFGTFFPGALYAALLIGTAVLLVLMRRPKRRRVMRLPTAAVGALPNEPIPTALDLDLGARR